MRNPYVGWFSPDKYIKDIIWDDLMKASKWAHGSLLDIGCGNKPYKKIFANKVEEYIGIDSKSLESDIKGDFYKIKIKRNSFDTVLSTQVLEHVATPEAFLKKIYRILKNDGVLILTAPLIGSLHEVPSDYYRYTKYGLKFMLEAAGLKIIQIKEQGNWLSSVGQHANFYLDLTFNRYGLKGIKHSVQFLITLMLKLTSFLPERIIKANLSPLNYMIIAKK